MFRYIAFVWNPEDPEAATVAQHLLGELKSNTSSYAATWHTALSGAGLTVLYTGARTGINECHQLTNNTGVVLGKLFTRNAMRSTSAPPTLSAPESQQILATQGRR